MPPEGGNDVCSGEEETAGLLTDSGGGDNAKKHKSSGKGKVAPWRRLPIKNAVQLLVFVDMLSVALVVPLLTSYFKDLNISTEQYGLMTSVYSLSQIVGGLVLGALSDRTISRRLVLLVSFLGSALSYGTIGLSSSLDMLLVGRVVVGLVKQTMTMSTAIVSEHTTAEDRSSELSRLTAAMTVAFIVGPAVGSFMYQRNKKLPPLVASCLFLINAILVLVLLPRDTKGKETANEASSKKKKDDAGGEDTKEEQGLDGVEGLSTGKGRSGCGDGKGGGAASRFAHNFKLACSSGPTIRILAAKLLYGFFMRSLAAQNFVGYYEERFEVESWALGYISSYTMGLSFVVQLYVVGHLTSRISEVSLVWWSLAAVSLANLAEGTPTLFGLVGYLCLVVPSRVAANAALGACLQSIFTQRVPQSDLGAALGALNVLLSASGVVGPLYGGKIMGSLGVLARPAVTAAHYAGFFVLWWAMEIRGVRTKRRFGTLGDEGESNGGRKGEWEDDEGSAGGRARRKKVE